MNEEQQVVQEDTEDFAALFEQHSAVNVRLAPGQKVSGTVIDISGDNVFVDVGIKVDGIMDRKDILNAEGEEIVKVGDSIEGWIVKMNSHEVYISRSMSGSGLAALEDACASAIPVDGRVQGTCKGGYTVDVLGKRAFCPGSQMEALGEGDDITGRTMQFLIMRVENHGRNIIVSRRALIDRERSENLEKVLADLKVGDTVEGKISRLVPFGAFVELAPSVEGLIHISELAWSRVATADEAVSVGDLVRAKVIGITKTEKGTRISLSRKQAEGDPWNSLGDRLEAGQIVQGKVVRLAPFGAFVEILPGIEGMVHVSEMAWGRRVNKPEEVVSPGETVTVKILEINGESRRIALSIRDAQGDPWADVPERFAPGTVVQGSVDSQSSYGIFVNLAPAVTGLLPMQNLKNAKNQAELKALKKGDPISVVVQRIDSEARKISLWPEGASEAKNAENSDWKKHAAAGTKTASLGVLGQALQKALQKK
ncbi:MAG: 30S ribosomal protein S1 [Desulfovibrio sp.]|nr:30S ribosomal protein S1 [Desulfovibrio sp.]